MGCSDIGSCLEEFILDSLNAPIKTLAESFQKLLSQNIDISSFASFWSVIVYALSFFYIFFFLYASMQFVSAGSDMQRRTLAKDSLKNAFVVLVLVQGSYFLYGLLIDASAALTRGMLSLLSERFFLPISSIHTNLFFVLLYVAALGATVIFLLIRFIFVAVGVVLFPVGIFLYFIPPLREYGLSIIYFFATLVFVPFFVTIVFLITDKLLMISFFEELKSLLLIATLAIVNAILLYVTVGALLKAFMGSKMIRSMGTVKYFL
ncbi:hypothetical protein J4207_02810 [Candidatus Woesearchaeota archaeon]|nr:hypothetical protein [Candidatus Woesearchaeota archaeon]